MAKRRRRRSAPLFDGPDGGAGTVPIVPDREQTVDLIDAAETRYLNYSDFGNVRLPHQTSTLTADDIDCFCGFALGRVLLNT